MSTGAPPLLPLCCGCGCCWHANRSRQSGCDGWRTGDVFFRRGIGFFERQKKRRLDEIFTADDSAVWFFPYFFHRRAAVASATGELMEKGTEMPPAVQGDGAIFWSVRCRYVAATFALRRSSCRCSARSAGGSRPEEQQSENAWNYRLYLRLLRPQGPAGGGGGGGGGGGKSLQLP